MRQKKIEAISHKINVDVILKCLWAIRDHDQFYFITYGKDMIENCIKQKVKSEAAVLGIMDKMCKQSLPPEHYEDWEKIKEQLIKNRNNLNTK